QRRDVVRHIAAHRDGGLLRARIQQGTRRRAPQELVQVLQRRDGEHVDEKPDRRPVTILALAHRGREHLARRVVPERIGGGQRGGNQRGRQRVVVEDVGTVPPHVPGGTARIKGIQD